MQKMSLSSGVQDHKRLIYGYWFVLVALYAAFVALTATHIDGWINADDASELVLARLLAKENRLITDSWFYSTELRVLNTQLVYTFFFKWTDNWHAVRVLSLALMEIMLVASCLLYCRSLKAGPKAVLLSALLITPFSREYLSVVLVGGYYIPHIMISFGVLALAEKGLESGKKGRWRLALGVAVSLLAGMGGPRQLVILYLPLMLACGFLWMKANREGKGLAQSKRYAVICALFFGAAAVGYGLNAAVLSRIFFFQSFDEIKFVPFSFERLEMVIAGLLNSYGFAAGKAFSKHLLSNVACALWVLTTAAALRRGLKSQEDDPAYYRLSVYVLFALAVFTGLYLFTDSMYYDRYNIPLIVFTVPLAACYFKRWDGKVALSRLLAVAMVAVCGLSWIGQAPFLTADANTELKTIAKTLTENGYDKGYASFWNANILTELSNGQIEVWDFGNANDLKRVETIDQRYDWLQPTAHATETPEGSVFLLLSANQYETCHWREALEDERVVYQSEGYILFGFEDYGDIPEGMVRGGG